MVLCKCLKNILTRYCYLLVGSAWWDWTWWTEQVTNYCPSVLDTVGWVIWPVKSSPMTYNVFGGTLNPTLLLRLTERTCVHGVVGALEIIVMMMMMMMISWSLIKRGACLLLRNDRPRQLWTRTEKGRWNIYSRKTTWTWRASRYVSHVTWSQVQLHPTTPCCINNNDVIMTSGTRCLQPATVMLALEAIIAWYTTDFGPSHSPLPKFHHIPILFVPKYSSVTKLNERRYCMPLRKAAAANVMWVKIIIIIIIVVIIGECGRLPKHNVHRMSRSSSR